jgi:hypothetical protein
MNVAPSERNGYCPHDESPLKKVGRHYVCNYDGVIPADEVVWDRDDFKNPDNWFYSGPE